MPPTPETTHMGRAELASDIADLIIEKLGAPEMPLIFPAGVGQRIHEACAQGAFEHEHVLPMNGLQTMFAKYRFFPDGTMQLTFMDPYRRPFWRGTFRRQGELHADS